MEFVSKLSPEKRDRLVRDNQALLRENNSRAIAEAETGQVSLDERTNLLSEEALSTSTNLPDIGNVKSSVDNESALPPCFSNCDSQPPILPTYGKNQNNPSVSAALEIKSPSTKALNSEITPNNKVDEVQPHEDYIKRGRHVVAIQNIDLGSVLFSEMPFSSALLPVAAA